MGASQLDLLRAATDHSDCHSPLLRADQIGWRKSNQALSWDFSNSNPNWRSASIAGNFVTLLDLINKLVTLAPANLPVIVGQTTPLLLCLSGKLLPVPLHLVAVHGPNPRFVGRILPTASVGLGLPCRRDDLPRLSEP
jgi:hypothetical protein